MRSKHITALATALTVATVAPRLAAQDTSSAANRARTDTSAYAPGTGVDTGVDTMVGGRADTAGWRKAVGDSSTQGTVSDSGARETTKAGDRHARKLRKHERRMHPGSDTTAAAQGTAGADDVSDTTGMSGRHRADSTMASDSITGSAPEPTRQPGQSTSPTTTTDSAR